MDLASTISRKDSPFFIPGYSNNPGESWCSTRNKICKVFDFFKLDDKQGLALTALCLRGAAAYRFAQVEKLDNLNFQTMLDKLDSYFLSRHSLAVFRKNSFVKGSRESVGDFFGRVNHVAADMVSYFGQSVIMESFIAYTFFEGLPSYIKNDIEFHCADAKMMQDPAALLSMAQEYELLESIKLGTLRESTPEPRITIDLKLRTTNEHQWSDEDRGHNSDVATAVDSDHLYQDIIVVPDNVCSPSSNLGTCSPDSDYPRKILTIDLDNTLCLKYQEETLVNQSETKTRSEIPEMVHVQTNIEGRSIACPSDKEEYLTNPQHNDAPGTSIIHENLQIVVGNNNKSVEYRSDDEGYFTDDEL